MAKLKRIKKFKEVQKLKVGDQVVLVGPPALMEVKDFFGEKKFLSSDESEVVDQYDLDADTQAGWRYYVVKN